MDYPKDNTKEDIKFTEMKRKQFKETVLSIAIIAISYSLSSKVFDNWEKLKEILSTIF